MDGAPGAGPLTAVSRVEVPHAALTLARAFHDDPVFALLFGGSVPEAKARRFFEIMTSVQLHHGLTFRTPATEAVAIWAPPDQWKLPPAAIARNSLAFLRLFGRRFVRNLALLSTLEKAHPKEPHYYLEFIGTDPRHQGQGLGTQLMTPMLERCDREGMPAYLESSKESNVPFYRRFGFEVIEVLTHRPLQPGDAGPQQWLMWRDPR